MPAAAAVRAGGGGPGTGPLEYAGGAWSLYLVGAGIGVLIGALLLEDLTVVKVMLSAILVGMIGVFTLHGLGKVQLHIEPTRLAAQISGGLVFGVGFALLAYCPGTGAAALGQGNWDALLASPG